MEFAGCAPAFTYGNASLYHADCIDWLAAQPEKSVHAVVTDPPYGIIEYTEKEQTKLRRGKGGVWRIPPTLNGHKRSPLPRFTTLSDTEREALATFFHQWAKALVPVLTPGAHVMVACNPLLSYLISGAVVDAGLERRGEIVRRVMTMRGGDRPKNAHEEFSDVTVMPRSMWEPWLLFRKPFEGTVADNLRKWGTGGLRRVSEHQPFGDVIDSAPTRPPEKKLAPHPSLKPQAFLRKVVRASLPLGQGVVLDPFAGSGSTLAAAEAVGYKSIGVEKDANYTSLASESIPALAAFKVKD
ncbi:DNA methyltransferase [Streptomyces chrestomyceticus]